MTTMFKVTSAAQKNAAQIDRTKLCQQPKANLSPTPQTTEVAS